MSTDGLRAWLTGVDCGIIKEPYTNESGTTHNETKYSPGNCTGIEKEVLAWNADQSTISTSYVERQNLTMRMARRRYTWLTTAFSKKVENPAHAVSLHYMHYNFARPHTALRIEDGPKRTPAMAAGKGDRIWSLTDIARLLE